MPQNPHINPRFRKPQGKIQFRADKALVQVLDKLAYDAIPNGLGDPPTKSEVARALVEQAAKGLAGRVAWMLPVMPTDKQIKLAAKAGYELSIIPIKSEQMDVNFDQIEEAFANVCAIHPWHVINCVKRGLTILIFENDSLYVYHGHGLVRRYTK
jgi:hypothetical protein